MHFYRSALTEDDDDDEWIPNGVLGLNPGPDQQCLHLELCRWIESLPTFFSQQVNDRFDSVFGLESKKLVCNEWWWSFGFLSMVGDQNSREEEEEEEVNDGVTVGFIYLPFHLLLLFFGAGSFFIFLFYWHRPSRVNRIESVKETDAFSNREAQREREREALWLIFRDWGHCRPRSLLLT